MSVAPELGKSVAQPLTSVVATVEGENIDDVLARFGGNREAAARHLGISRTTLWRKLRQQAKGQE